METTEHAAIEKRKQGRPILSRLWQCSSNNSDSSETSDSNDSSDSCDSSDSRNSSTRGFNTDDSDWTNSDSEPEDEGKGRHLWLKRVPSARSALNEPSGRSESSEDSASESDDVEHDESSDQEEEDDDDEDATMTKKEKAAVRLEARLDSGRQLRQLTTTALVLATTAATMPPPPQTKYSHRNDVWYLWKLGAPEGGSTSSVTTRSSPLAQKTISLADGRCGGWLVHV